MERIKHLIKNKPLTLFLAFIIFWTPVIVFLKIAGDIIEKEPVLFDVPILNYIHTFASPFGDKFFQLATNLGSVTVIAAATAVLLSYFLYKKQLSLIHIS